MRIEWADFKNYLIKYKLNFFFHDCNKFYELFLMFGDKELSCYLPRAQESYAEQVLDFETNFKALGNKPLAMAQTPYAAKNYNDKKLFKRVHGVQSDCVQGDNEIVFEIPYPWVKITALEVINGEALDTVAIKIFDNELGSYSGVSNKMMNQFGFTVNVAKDFYSHSSAFDADLYQGLKIVLTYNSKSAKTVGVNFNMDELK